MFFVEAILIALALSLDAFSVAIICGLKLQNNKLTYFKIALFFGVFQFLMPIAGFFISFSLLRKYLENYANFFISVIFLLLSIKSLYDYIKNTQLFNKTKIHQPKSESCECQGYSCPLIFAISTSIDAFVIGTALGVYSKPWLLYATIIGIITFLMSLLGCNIGFYSSLFLKDKSKIAAAIILAFLAATYLWK